MAVALREPTPRPPVEGCPRGFYAVEPKGFVCSDYKITLNTDHPIIAAMREHFQAAEGPFPFHYALSLGAPMYNRLPDAETHRVVMMRYPKPKSLGDWAIAFEDLADPSIPLPLEPIPEFLRDGKRSPGSSNRYVRRSLPHGSMLSFSKAFEHGGRSWLLADDLSLVPADRVLVYRPTSFRGVLVNEDLSLGFGWSCGGNHPRYEQREGKMVQSDEVWPARTLLRLSTNTKQEGKHRFRQLRDGLSWIRSDHLCAVPIARKLPEGAKEDSKWIYVSTLHKTLVAYQGLRPVYATLHASGRGGIHQGKGDVRNYTTPLGAFHINWKERYATLSPDPGAPTTFWISNVMFVQYFQQPYALHGAYWHERFGVPTSAGCPNLSPYDAQYLFEFTDPVLPDGWQGIAPGRGEPTTLVVIGS